MSDYEEDLVRMGMPTEFIPNILNSDQYLKSQILSTIKTDNPLNKEDKLQRRLQRARRYLEQAYRASVDESN